MSRGRGDSKSDNYLADKEDLLRSAFDNPSYLPEINDGEELEIADKIFNYHLDLLAGLDFKILVNEIQNDADIFEDYIKILEQFEKLLKSGKLDQYDLQILEDKIDKQAVLAVALFKVEFANRILALEEVPLRLNRKDIQEICHRYRMNFQQVLAKLSTKIMTSAEEKEIPKTHQTTTALLNPMLIAPSRGRASAIDKSAISQADTKSPNADAKTTAIKPTINTVVNQRKSSSEDAGKDKLTLPSMTSKKV